MDKQDRCLKSIAAVKLEVADAEKKLARCRADEYLLLHELFSIREELAVKRVKQASINIERADHHYRLQQRQPKTIGAPSNILAAMSVPSTGSNNGVGPI